MHDPEQNAITNGAVRDSAKRLRAFVDDFERYYLMGEVDLSLEILRCLIANSEWILADVKAHSPICNSPTWGNERAILKDKYLYINAQNRLHKLKFFAGSDEAAGLRLVDEINSTPFNPTFPDGPTLRQEGDGLYVCFHDHGCNEKCVFHREIEFAIE